jgi:hypothetical protein
MKFYPNSDCPPPNFVAFLAQRSGLSEEAAEHRLEDWLDEYYSSTSQRARIPSAAAAASVPPVRCSESLSHSA